MKAAEYKRQPLSDSKGLAPPHAKYLV